MALTEFYNVHKQDIFVGYNSRNYDQFIFKGLLLKMNPAYINEQLITYRKPGHQIVKKANTIPFNNYDVSDIQHSLKQLEAFMGHDIKESQMDFTIDRPLTKAEIEETIKYCTHDVTECLDVLEYKIGDFEAQFSLIETFNLEFEMFNKTKAQLSAHILGAVKQSTMDDEFDITIPPTLKLGEKYQFVVDWFNNPENKAYKKATFSYEKQHKRELNCMVAGVPHIFAYGGVHGAIPNYHAKGIILLADVASLYPSIMIEYGYLSRKLKNPQKYREIRDERLRLKKLKDKKQQPMKIVLNSTYGILKDENNPLYDPLMSNNVCITGQLLLLDLIEKVEPFCKLIQSNTDGIYMLVNDMKTVDQIKQIAHEWETRTKLSLEFDIYDEIYQKDVNNYILISKDGHYKSKGAYLKKLSPIDNDLPIINKALIEYFVHGTPVEKTINDATKLMDFQKVVKLTHLYKGVVYGEGSTETINGKSKVVVRNAEPLREKVHRVFASVNPHAKGLYKTKIENNEPIFEKISYTPDHCFINNDNILNVEVPAELDRQYYIDVANDRLNQILNVSEEKINPLPEKLYNNMLESDTFYNFLKLCKENLSIKTDNKTFIDYIKSNCCENYGKTKKLVLFTKWFTLLFNKKTLRVDMVETKFSEIKKVILKYSELSKSGKTFTINSDLILRELWNIIPNDDLELSEILETQIKLFERVRYINSEIDDGLVYVLNSRTKIKPNFNVYQLKTGKVFNVKIESQLYNILPLQDGDIVKVNKAEYKFGQKIIGKDKDGINIITQDDDKQYLYFYNYDIVYRNYKKLVKSLVED